MTAVDRGTPLTQALEALRRTELALERNIGNPTEEDWRAQVFRARERVLAVAAAEVRPGLVFRHKRLLDPDWKPGSGQRYADAPHAVCRVTAIRLGSVYYAIGADATKGQLTLDLNLFPYVIEEVIS